MHSRSAIWLLAGGAGIAFIGGLADCVCAQDCKGNGVSFDDPHTVDANFNAAYSVYAADMDGDGDLDILGAARTANQISVWRNVDGDGSVWAEHIVDNSFASAHTVHAADVDGDGDLDIVGAAGDGINLAWWENIAGNGLIWGRRTVEADFHGAHAAVGADMDGDGDIDVLAAGADSIAWFENTAGDGFEWIKHTVIGVFDNALFTRAVDVDLDGDLDVVGAASKDDDIAWFENTAGDGTAWIEHIVDTSFDGAHSVDAADIDGDGDIDMLGAAFDGDEIAWWSNEPGAHWIRHTIDATYAAASSVYAADIDGDGDVDILGAAYERHDITLWENVVGDGSVWIEHTLDGRFEGAFSVYAADVDGDGDLDVLGAALEDDDIAWWPNTTVLCLADFNDDNLVGTADLLFLLGAWGTDPGCAPDLDGDGNVGASDLIELLGNWGPCQ